MQFKLKSEYVTLGQVLKFAGVIGSGGEARIHLSESPVLVNGELEQRRGRKLRGGDTVSGKGFAEIRILSADEAAR
jgi:ribosome-associated protein YbcJ (S4-like RNA binding protein)